MTDQPTTDPIPEEELVPEDDRIIGHVFRWSLLVIAIIGVVAVGGLLLTGRDGRADAVIAKEIGPIEDLDQADEQMPEVHFRDVTRESGVDFVHVSGARGRKLLPETMGGGIAFLDYDGDRDQDLLLVSGTDWPDAPRPLRTPSLALYANDGTGRFEKLPPSVLGTASFYGFGPAVADYDNDGDPDIFVTALGPNRLLRNDGDRFTDVTGRAGVAGGGDTWSSSAGFFDYDNDGDLDLFVCNYVKWSKKIDLELNFTLNGHDRAYGPPTNYEGSYSYLYRNEGDGTFKDVSKEAGIQVDNPITGRPMGKALAVTFSDIDSDGQMDILVANDTVQNFLFHNLGNGRFEETGATSGFGFDGTGKATGAMGIDLGHYRNDDQTAIGIGNFANEMTSLYVSQGPGLQFTDEAAGEGIGSPSRAFLSFGLFFFDYDLDGRLDLLQANGHLEDEISQVQASQQYRQPAQLFWNAGPDARSCFAEVPGNTTGDLSRPIVGRGAAYADIDGDGDLDFVLTETGGAPLLLRNEQRLGHHWLRVGLVGTRCNRDAIGAWVDVTAGGVTQSRQVMPTRSYISQVERTLTFGLGRAERIDSIRIRWPDGTRQEVTPPAADRFIVVTQEGS